VERIGCFWGHGGPDRNVRGRGGGFAFPSLFSSPVYLLPDTVSRIKGSQDQSELGRDKAIERERERVAVKA